MRKLSALFATLFAFLLMTLPAHAQTPEKFSDARLDGSSVTILSTSENNTLIESLKRSGVQIPNDTSIIRFTFDIGALPAMCCGSVNSSNNTGDNCAFLSPGRSCAGDILACGGGCESIDGNGGGSCC